MLDIGGQFDLNTGIATTGTGFLTVANGGQLANGTGNFFDTFIGVGTGSVGGVTVTGAAPVGRARARSLWVPRERTDR